MKDEEARRAIARTIEVFYELIAISAMRGPTEEDQQRSTHLREVLLRLRDDILK